MSASSRPYEITTINPWEVRLDGDADGDGDEGKVLEIRGGDELKGLSGPQREAMLGAVASFGWSLTAFVEARPRLDRSVLDSAATAGALAAGAILEATEGKWPSQRLLRERAASLQEAAGRVMRLMVDATSGNVEIGAQEIADRTQTAADICQVLFAGDERQVAALIDALEPVAQSVADPELDIDLRDAEARARIRLKAMYRKVLHESLTVAEMRDTFNVSRQRLKQLRDEGRLFAVDIPYQKGLVYPSWQLDESGRPRQAVQPLIREARAGGLDALGFHLLMTGRREGGRTGIELLQMGREDLALALVRGADR